MLIVNVFMTTDVSVRPYKPTYSTSCANWTINNAKRIHYRTWRKLTKTLWYAKYFQHLNQRLYWTLSKNGSLNVVFFCFVFQMVVMESVLKIQSLVSGIPSGRDAFMDAVILKSLAVSEVTTQLQKYQANYYWLRTCFIKLSESMASFNRWHDWVSVSTNESGFGVKPAWVGFVHL